MPLKVMTYDAPERPSKLPSFVFVAVIAAIIAYVVLH
jgi:hypothetical protein